MGRNAHRRTRPIAAPAELPSAFFDRLRTQLGDEVDGLADALNAPSPVSIRANTQKWNGPPTGPIPWCANGHYLPERPAFTFDPLLHAGCYYVQEASSMLLEQALLASGFADASIVALDLCAAPGGKSTHLRCLLHPDALLVSNEIDRKRQVILQENLWKWGAANTVITGNAPKEFDRLPEFFDLILVDAPCSGEGMFRKDAFAREQWSTELVGQCTTMQSSALEHAWESLKAGGVLIYSTCTWEVEENEAQLARLMERGGECIAIPTDPAWGVVRSGRLGVDGLRCYPHRVRGEGFFIAMVRKPGERDLQRTVHTVDTRSTNTCAEWLRPSRIWTTLEQNDQLFAVDAIWANRLKALSADLRVLSPGTPLAERKAGEWRPHSALALSQDLVSAHFHSVNLDRDQALAYLRGSAVPATAAQGVALATYQGIGLGWLQGAGNRWNNRWPVAWRIRAQHPNAPHVSWAQAH